MIQSPPVHHEQLTSSAEGIGSFSNYLGVGVLSLLALWRVKVSDGPLCFSVVLILYRPNIRIYFTYREVCLLSYTSLNNTS